MMTRDRKLDSPRHWDSIHSLDSVPILDLQESAALLGLVNRIEIPRHLWSALARHPDTMKRYENLRALPAAHEKCEACGAEKAVFRPPLDSKTVDFLLNANSDGPILPGAVVVTDNDANEVWLTGSKGSIKLTSVCDPTRMAA